jgi:hypothetical protein
MIPFFRKIRRGLLSENKVSKYLLYARGEIVLVVIGILIALQINNWNETQKNKRAETQVLSSLLQEFEENLLILDDAIEMNKQIIAQGIKVGEFTGPSQQGFSEAELSEVLVGAFKYESRI